jgi:hypothetical protein
MLVFFWPPTYELVNFSRFFEETQLASFGAHQTWTLQGDYIFNSVYVTEDPARPQIKWLPERGNYDVPPANWQTHKRLDLYIPSKQQIHWTVRLPEPTISALFTAKLINKAKDQRTFFLNAQVKGAPEQTLSQVTLPPNGSRRISIDLSLYKGRETTLSMLVDGSGHTSGMSLRYPRIELEQMRTPTAFTAVGKEDEIYTSTPENTDLASINTIENTQKDIVLNGNIEAKWIEMYSNALTPPGGAVCAGDYRALKVNMSVPKEIQERMVKIIVATREYTGNYYESEIQLPLLKDDQLHTYTVDLKLLPLNKSNRIETVRLATLVGGLTPEQQATVVDIPEVRLVRANSEKTFCTR